MCSSHLWSIHALFLLIYAFLTNKNMGNWWISSKLSIKLLFCRFRPENVKCGLCLLILRYGIRSVEIDAHVISSRYTRVLPMAHKHNYMQKYSNQNIRKKERERKERKKTPCIRNFGFFEPNVHFHCAPYKRDVLIHPFIIFQFIPQQDRVSIRF